jgi:hypothetical protein
MRPCRALECSATLVCAAMTKLLASELESVDAKASTGISEWFKLPVFSVILADVIRPSVDRIGTRIAVEVLLASNNQTDHYRIGVREMHGHADRVFR